MSLTMPVKDCLFNCFRSFFTLDKKEMDFSSLIENKENVKIHQGIPDTFDTRRFHVTLK